LKTLPIDLLTPLKKSSLHRIFTWLFLFWVIVCFCFLFGLSLGCVYLLFSLVWTLCLMHRCVCIWRYILQNYNYKLHFQNLSIYHIPHVFIRTLAAENLDVCTACDPWEATYSWYWYQNLGGAPPPRARHVYPRQPHMRRRGDLFISAKVFFPAWCHPWMDDRTNGWMDEWVTWWKKL